MTENRRAQLTRVVTSADTARSFGEHFPAAASTPFVLGMAEVACHNAVASELAPDEITVGVQAHVDHLAPTPTGGTLTATATETSRDGRKITFHVEVVDDAGVCARIEHQRAVVRAEIIEARLASRLPDALQQKML